MINIVIISFKTTRLNHISINKYAINTNLYFFCLSLYNFKNCEINYYLYAHMKYNINSTIKVF